MDKMSDERWFTIRNARWSAGQIADVRNELDRARAEETRLAEQLSGAVAMVESLREAERLQRKENARLSEECASRFRLAEEQEARATRAERALEQKEATIKALADALEKARAQLQRTQPEYHIAGDALWLVGRLP